MYYITDNYHCHSQCLNKWRHLFRLGINYFVVTHETGHGLMAYHSKGRPTKEHQRKRLECPELIEKEIMEIRKQLRLSKNAKLLMIVSIAIDDMVRLVSMHPEVWFMDVTGGTNLQNRDLFMLAICKPTGETFPGNLTVIPSGKRWIFVCLYEIGFIALYGSVTCPRNCKTLCDEDDAEYGPFENAIATLPEFEKSQLMLCVFHAVWQPFKKEIFPYLPKNTGKSKELTAIGEMWGKFIFLYHSCTSLVINFLMSKYVFR